MDKPSPSNIFTWFKTNFGDIEDNFWSIPVSLYTIVFISDDEKTVSASEVRHRTKMYGKLLEKLIKDSLEKLKVHLTVEDYYNQQKEKYYTLVESLAICFVFKSENFDEKTKKKIAKITDFKDWFFVAKLDVENKKITFNNKSFAQSIVARILVNQVTGNGSKEPLNNDLINSILMNGEFSQVRSHICGILASSHTFKMNLNLKDIIDGLQAKFLKMLIEEDCYELFLNVSEQLRYTHVNFIMEDGTNLLYLALRRSRTEFLQLILESGAEFEHVLGMEFVLHMAVEKGLNNQVKQHFEILKLNVNQKNDKNEFNPLHYAAKDGSLEMVQFLVDNDAQVNVKDKYKKTALYYAIEANSNEVVDFLITRESDLTKALKWAAQLNSRDIFDKIYEITADEFKAVRLRKALATAAKCGHLEMCKHLVVYHRANPSDSVKHGDLNVHIAASEGHLQCVEYFFNLQETFDVNVRNDSKETALMKALWNDQEEVVEWLLDKNADFNAVDNNGRTCLDHASIYIFNKKMQLTELNAVSNTTLGNQLPSMLQEKLGKGK